MPISHQDFLSIPTAIERATGNRPHPSTCWRWATQGAGGHILKTWMLGGRRKTTVKAVHEFIEARTQATTPAANISEVRAKLNKELGI